MGADIHVHNDGPLRISCYRGNFQMIKLLIENGANVHAKDN